MLQIKAIRVQQELLDTYCCYPFLIAAQLHISTYNNNLLERIPRSQKRALFLRALRGIRQCKGRLYVVAPAALICDEINLYALAFAIFCNINHANVNLITPCNEFIEKDVFHNVGFFLLPEIEAGIAQSDIFEIVL